MEEHRSSFWANGGQDVRNSTMDMSRREPMFSRLQTLERWRGGVVAEEEEGEEEGRR